MTQNRKADLFGNEIDIVVYAEFPSIDALHAYKKHPTYMDVTNTVRPRRELRFAADVEAEGLICGQRRRSARPRRPAALVMPS